MWDCSDNLSAAIPAVASATAVDFPKLAEIHVLSEVLPHRSHIGVVLVACDLIPAIGASAEIGDERMSVDAISRPDAMRDDELGFAVECKPDHCAAPLVGVTVAQMRLARMHEAPHLIHLNVPGADVPHSRIKHMTRFP